MALLTVYVTRKIPDAFRVQLAAVGRVESWDRHEPVPREVLLEKVKVADALLCMGDDVVDREIIQAGVALKVISTATAGYDHIDLDAAREYDVTVCHAPGAAEHAVADLTIALLLSCARHLVDADYFVKNREWKYWYPDLFIGTDVRGQSIGIVGLGRIGIQVAHRAMGFGMRVLYHDAHRHPDAESRMGVQYGSLDNLLREADFVTLHVPLTEKTRGLINEDRLRLMKPSAYLINVARGPIVDRDALVKALREGWIAGAGLDVFEQEPLPDDDPLLSLDNVIITPHIGANTRGALDAMIGAAAKQIIQVLQGKQPSHPVILPGRKREAA